MSEDILQRIFKEVRGWYDINNGRKMLKLASEVKSGEVVEIGSWCGLSSLCLGLGHKVWCVDNHGKMFADTYNSGKRTLGEFFDNIIKFNLEGRVIPLVGKSGDILEIWSRPIGLLFIDDGHTKEEVSNDYKWAKFLVPGGVVVFHDINHPPIKEFLDETVRKELTEFEPGYFRKEK